MTVPRTPTAVLLAAFLAASPALAQEPKGGYSGHGADSVPKEVIEKFGPRPLPSSLSRKIQSMLDLRAPGLGVPSPDGKKLFFGWAVTGVGQVWRLDGPDRFPVQLTGGEDATDVVGITPDGKWLVLSRDRRGEENPGLYLQSPSGGTLREIQHVEKVQTIFDFVTDDSAWIWFHSNDEKADSYTVYRWNVASGKREKMFGEPGLWNVADHRADGSLLLSKATGSLSSEWFEWNPAAKKLVPLFGQNEKEEYAALYGPKPGELVVLTSKGGNFRRLHVWKDGRLTRIGAERSWDVESFSIDEGKSRILYEVNEAGYGRLFAMDARSFEPIPLPKLAEADQLFAGTTTRSGRFTTIGIETGTAPRTSYVLDWKSGKLTRWLLPSSPEIDTTLFARATLESYPARDGTKIPMFVRRPKGCPGDEPCPVVVEFHGGPESQSRPGFQTTAQLFVDAGFVYVQPNVRGSDGYGRAWLDADNGPKRLDVVTDIEDCAKFIRTSWGKNGHEPKIGVFGGSYGGYSVLAAMTMFAGAFDAGVSIVGIANLVTFLENTAPYRRILRTSEYGDPEKDRDALVKLSPTTHVDKLKGPLLIIQGASDPRVPVGEALLMHETLEKRGIPSELLIFADEGHGARKRENRVQQTGRSLEFFEKHLLGRN
jgi:dipeptidyl aminopeptidase/acylaminoacyl peptidase